MNKLILFFLIVLTGYSTIQAQSKFAKDELSGKITTFWNFFSKNEKEIFAASRENPAINYELVKQIHLINENLQIIIGSEILNGKRDIILTCQGKSEYFDLCDRIIGAAPKFSRFNLLSLFPQLDKVENFELYSIAGLTLYPQEVKVNFSSEGETLSFLFVLPDTHLSMILNDKTDQFYSAYLQALYTLVFQALGERITARVKSATIAPLSTIEPSIPLLELKNHIK